MFSIQADEQQDLRRVILTAARELLTAGSELSMRTLAQRIGCSPGTIYLYFHNKSELLLCLAEENLTRLTDLLDGLRERHQRADPVLVLKKAVYTCVEFWLRHREQYDAVLVQQLVPMATLRDFISRCVEEDAFRPEVDLDTACVSLCVMIHGLTSMLITGASRADRAMVIEQVINTIVAGLTGSSEPRAKAASVA
jgi:AcrR family transcriptional regulator